MHRKTAGEIKMSLMQMMGQKIDVTLIDRIYRREEVDQLPEHIKANLKPIVDGLAVEHHRWPKRKEMLFVIQDGEQQRLARWYPLGMQDEVFQQYMYRHGFPDGWGMLAHIRPGASADYPIACLERLLPLTTFAEGVAVTIDQKVYPARINAFNEGDYDTETEQGCVYVHNDTAIQIEHLLKRDIKPVYLTGWRDARVAQAASDKLQSVRPVRCVSPSAVDMLSVLRDSCCAEGFIHPLGYALVHDVSQFVTSQRTIKVQIRKDGDWLPVVGVNDHNEDLAREIERTGYVRWDIADLKP